MSLLSPQLDLPPEIPAFPNLNPVAITCHWSMNGKLYGGVEQISLKDNDPINNTAFDVEIECSQPSLPGFIQLIVKVGRDQSSSIKNPYNHKFYYLNLNIYVRDLNDLSASDPIPEHFNVPDNVTTKDKIHLSFSTDKIIVSGETVIPSLINEKNRPSLEALVKAVTDPVLREDGFKFHLILSDKMSFVVPRLLAKFKTEGTQNLLHLWMKDSPLKHELRQGNIHAPNSRPPLQRGRIANIRVPGCREGFLVPLVYALKDEHLLQYAESMQIGEQTFKAAFMPVLSSAGKTCPLDNEEAKIILASVVWESSLMKRPKEGETYTFVLNFPIPDCPEPTDGVTAAPHRPLSENSDDGIDDHGEFITTRQTNADKNDAIEENHQEYIMYRRKCWHAVVLPPSELNGNAQPLFALYRPVDSSYTGVNKEEAPTVGTVIPYLQTEIDNFQRIRDILADENAVRHHVSIKEDISDSTFNDLVRGLNDFAKLSSSPEALKTSLAAHLSELCANGDRSLQYQPILLSESCSKKWKSFANGLSKSQQKAFEHIMADPTAFLHGAHLIAGVPAAGKSLILERVIAAWTQADRPLKSQVLFVTDGNTFVNEAAERFASYLKTIPNLISKPVTIIRVGAWSTEEDMFTSPWGARPRRDYFSVEVTSEFAVQSLIDDLGRSSAEKKLRGDTRLDPNLRFLSLAEAMKVFMKENPSNDWDRLTSLMTQRKDNPLDTTIQKKDITELLNLLRKQTLANADVIFATCGMALRPMMMEGCKPVLLIKDEDCQSPRWFTPSLLSTYASSLSLAILSGDQEQKVPHLQTLIARDIPAPFALFARYTFFAQLKDLGCSLSFLRVQFRMFNEHYVRMLSDHRYNSTMLDGNADKTHVAVKFMTAFFKKEFGFNSNVGMIRCTKSFPTKVEGSPSTVNLGMQMWAMGMLTRFYTFFDQYNSRDLNKKEFAVRVLSPYLGVVNWIKNQILVRFPGRRISCTTFNVSQGTGANFCLCILPSKVFSDFAGNPRDDLVASTRWKHGFLRIVTAESTEPKTWNMDSVNSMLCAFRSKMNTEHFLFFKKQGWIAQVEAEEGRVCSKCHKVGHMKDSCLTKNTVCSNCYTEGHESKECTRPKAFQHKGKIPTCHRCSQDGHVAKNCKVCKHCGELGHKVPDCPRDWCSHCKNISHKTEDCPSSKCTVCNTTGVHWTSNCPTKGACDNCGGKHATVSCSEPINVQEMFTGNFLEPDFINQERKLDRELHPEFYKSYTIETDDEMRDRMLAQLFHVTVAEVQNFNDIDFREDSDPDWFLPKVNKLLAIMEHTRAQRDADEMILAWPPSAENSYSEEEGYITFADGHKVPVNSLLLPYGSDASYILTEASIFYSLPAHTFLPTTENLEPVIIHCQGGILLPGFTWTYDGNSITSFKVNVDPTLLADRRYVPYGAANIIREVWSEDEFGALVKSQAQYKPDEYSSDEPDQTSSWATPTSDTPAPAEPTSSSDNAAPASTTPAEPTSSSDNAAPASTTTTSEVTAWGDIHSGNADW